MSTTALKIFSYLPNPRVWKAQIAAEYCKVSIEVVGDAPPNLQHWLWDFDARMLNDDERDPKSPHARTGRRGFNATLYKTDAFLKAHPFGTVPAAFSPNGSVGIFESNSILRAVARLGQETCNLYGEDAYAASRIDSFLDATLVFAREAQEYLLAQPDITLDLYNRMSAAYDFYLSGVEQALSQTPYVAGDDLSIADIALACDLGQFISERKRSAALKPIGKAPLSANLKAQFPRTTHHLIGLFRRAEFNRYLSGALKRLDG